ncbi:hypothetical protein F8388_002437 [Cannabis sativa]|uniref:RING-type E3 ubiquitin transferase n=1 Tax=Cannabis sativa TaxID=3483 RepID=A0A7J6E6K9_CANSA|nr:hypothetical protein F8388_002437 [Cannabis sativa]
MSSAGRLGFHDFFFEEFAMSSEIGFAISSGRLGSGGEGVVRQWRRNGVPARMAVVSRRYVRLSFDDTPYIPNFTRHDGIKFIVFHVRLSHTIIDYSENLLLPTTTTTKTHYLDQRSFLIMHDTLTQIVLMGSNLELPFIDLATPHISTFALRNLEANPNSLYVAVSINIHTITARFPTPLQQQQQDEDVLDRSFREALDTVQTVPATQDSIRALQDLSDDDDGLSSETCSICLEKISSFGDCRSKGVEMPCSHVFHKDCIVQWLEISHLCPLCRYPMPTTTSSSS